MNGPGPPQHRWNLEGKKGEQLLANDETIKQPSEQRKTITAESTSLQNLRDTALQCREPTLYNLNNNSYLEKDLDFLMIKITL